MPEPSRVLYLHGFASSPASRKARFFSAQLEQQGFRVETPDLAEGDFEHLTISKQLATIARVAPCEPVTLIGSSLGGYLAALFAATHPEVERLILLAPAFGFYRLWSQTLGPERLRAWEEEGTLSVFHYGQGCTMPLAFEILEDARQFPPFPEFAQPCLIFHGVADNVVPIESSIEFAAAHPNAQLIKLPGGHELTDVLDDMWNASKNFLLPNRPFQ